MRRTFKVNKILTYKGECFRFNFYGGHRITFKVSIFGKKKPQNCHVFTNNPYKNIPHL